MSDTTAATPAPFPEMRSAPTTPQELLDFLDFLDKAQADIEALADCRVYHWLPGFFVLSDVLRYCKVAGAARKDLRAKLEELANVNSAQKLTIERLETQFDDCRRALAASRAIAAGHPRRQAP